MNHRINLTVAASAVAFPLSVSGPSLISVVPSCAVVAGMSETYSGPYEFTPGPSEQTIPIADMVAAQDIVVHAIPNNYGLITWNGSTLTVS